LKSRFGSTLEPFSTVNLEYFQKEDRELVSVRHVEMVRSCFETASEPTFLHTFSYIADLLMSFVPPHDANETLYRMVKACVEASGNSHNALLATRLYFELWLLRLGGYLPDWKVCDGCKRALTENETADVKADFHLLCPDCRRSSGGQSISGPQRELVRSALKLSPREFLDSTSEKREDMTEVSKILKRIISNVIGREVATEKSFAVNF